MRRRKQRPRPREPGVQFGRELPGGVEKFDPERRGSPKVSFWAFLDVPGVRPVVRDSKRVPNVDAVFQKKPPSDPGRIATGRIATEDRATTSPAPRDV